MRTGTLAMQVKKKKLKESRTKHNKMKTTTATAPGKTKQHLWLGGSLSCNKRKQQPWKYSS